MPRGTRRAAAALLALAAVLALPTAASARTLPLRLRSASLVQKGQQLIWRAQLNRPFYFRELKRQRRSLCLLVETRHGGRLAGRACVVSPDNHQGQLLVYAPFTAGRYGHWRVTRASITRSSSSEVTVSLRPAVIGLSYQSLRWQAMSSVAAPACTPQVAPRSHPVPGPCARFYPSRPRLIRLHTPRLVGCVPSGSSLVSGGPSSRHELALTFDDGPWPDPPTADFLNVLERRHVPATFFEIGNQISEYDPTGSLERRMLADGDMIGDHTWTHPNMVNLSPSAQRSQLEMTAAAIRNATGGFEPCFWRPPYGSVNSGLVSLARSLGMLTIQWDVDTVDWSLPGTATIYQRAVSGAHNGAIILQHFGGGPRYQTLDALPQEITTLRREGYRFVNVAQLLGLRLIYK